MFSEYPDIMSVPDVKKALGICTSNAYRLVNSGELRSFRIGKSIRVPKRALIEYVSKFGCFEVETDERPYRKGGSANAGEGQLTG